MKGKGFTLVELMVVVLIVAVLAAVLAPYLTARLEAARWSEGKAGCGTLATALRASWAEHGEEDWDAATDPEAYLTIGDLRGKYFSVGDYTIIFGAPDLPQYPITYTISVSQPTAPTVIVNWTKAGYSLDHTGKWTED
jgi:prepilin-type N-terminal cleavage/methylation domain-containing protein